MDCEVCGERIYGKEHDVIIDGARLMACPACVKFATSTPPTHKHQATSMRGPTLSDSRQREVSNNLLRDDQELVENYNSIVREARQKMGLTHKELSRKIGEKISQLQKLETGKMVPDQALIKKLQHVLKIKLLQPFSSSDVLGEVYTKKSSELTLADVLSIQRKKSGSTEE